MMEHVAWIPPGLDSLQWGVVLLVVQGIPRHSGGVQGRVREVGVRMVDQRSIVRRSRYRYATGACKYISVKSPGPPQVLRFLSRIQPAGTARHVEDGVA